jgi:type I restriction enzyme M protein
MSTDSSATIVSKVWNYAHVLKNAGVGYGDYVEQITYMLFLKLADEMTELGFDPPSPRLRRAGNPIPAEFQWSKLSSKSGDELEWSGATWTTRQGCPEGGRGGAHQVHYRHTLEILGTEPGLVGIMLTPSLRSVGLAPSLAGCLSRSARLRKAQKKISNPSFLAA